MRRVIIHLASSDLPNLCPRPNLFSRKYKLYVEEIVSSQRGEQLVGCALMVIWKHSYLT